MHQMMKEVGKMSEEQLRKLKLAVTSTINAWQDAESQHGAVTVDNGNINTFVRDIHETIEQFIKDYTRERYEPVEACPISLDYEQEYYRMCERYKEKEELCEKLNKALINVACQL